MRPASVSKRCTLKLPTSTLHRILVCIPNDQNYVRTECTGVSVLFPASINSYTKFGTIVASNAYGAPYAKTLISAKVEMRVFCLLRLCPKPRRTQFCLLETLEISSGCAMLQIAEWASTPVFFKFSLSGERIIPKNPIYICFGSLQRAHILPGFLVICVHGFFLR